MKTNAYTTRTGMIFHPDLLGNRIARNLFRPLERAETTTLGDAIDRKIVWPDSKLVLGSPDPKKAIGISFSALSYYHVAQGALERKEFMFSFCDICHSGALFSPLVDGTVHHFFGTGIYNGYIVLEDKETGSYWDHMTGECLYGRHQGKELELIDSLYFVQADALLQSGLDTPIIIPRIRGLKKLINTLLNKYEIGAEVGFLPPGFRKNMGEVDSRLPEMEVGLGVWKGREARFYTMNDIKKNGPIEDRFADKNIVVWFDQKAGTPQIAYADPGTWLKEEDQMTLSGHTYVSNGVFYDASGSIRTIERPMYQYARWYGFSSNFPQTTIYGRPEMIAS